jgi:hypothetical protein
VRLAAASRLEATPMSFASAGAPAPLPTTLASMSTILHHLPKGAIARRTLAVAPAADRSAQVELIERRIFQVSASGERQAQVLVVGGRLSPEEAAKVRRAIAESVAEGRALRFRIERVETGGGGNEGGFGIRIQTLVKGEE